MKDINKNDDGNGGYDLIVIGAGSAGFSASITAADAGKRVALVGHGTIGGTCVNVGCVPSKVMIRAAEAIHGAHAAKRFPGLSGQAQVDDWQTLIQSKDDLVATLRQKKYADLLPEYDGVDYIAAGPARLIKGGVIVGGRTLTAPKLVIATGGRPVLPTIDGIEDIGALDSTSLLELESLPKSLIFIGAGYIGTELAQMMSRMGVKVTLVTRSHLLPGAEPEVSEALTDAFVAEGITLLTGLSYENVRRDAAGVILRVMQGGEPVEVTADYLVSTAGRRANTDGMGLDAVGVETDARGSIVIGDDM
jgi:mercuric reductase